VKSFTITFSSLAESGAGVNRIDPSRRIHAAGGDGYEVARHYGCNPKGFVQKFT
jgi:hypothetical protein